MNVLLVEDEERIAAFLAKGLRRRSHTVDVVGGGQDALGALLSQSPEHDLLVLDLGLPDIDGLEVLRRVRERGVALPVIVVTARTGGNDRARARELGVEDYLVKPFRMNELLASVERHDPRRRDAAVSAP